MAKILGVYRIGYKNSQNNTEKKLDLLVMENLFYGRKMAQVGLKALVLVCLTDLIFLKFNMLMKVGGFSSLHRCLT